MTSAATSRESSRPQCETGRRQRRSDATSGCRHGLAHPCASSTPLPSGRLSLGHSFAAHVVEPFERVLEGTGARFPDSPEVYVFFFCGVLPPGFGVVFEPRAVSGFPRLPCRCCGAFVRHVQTVNQVTAPVNKGYGEVLSP